MQLFANLIENAIRHCQNGALIRIQAQRQLSGLVVEISDNGPGIPEEEREAVFRRLYRLERSRTSPGTGLGLSLVKAIADLHEAAITLDDNEPGLNVTARFPLVRVPATEAARK
jgi:signal transduction histidine kinase